MQKNCLFLYPLLSSSVPPWLFFRKSRSNFLSFIIHPFMLKVKRTFAIRFATCSWMQSLCDLSVGDFNSHWQKHPPHPPLSALRNWSRGMLICVQTNFRKSSYNIMIAMLFIWHIYMVHYGNPWKNATFSNMPWLTKTSTSTLSISFGKIRTSHK